MTVTEEIKDRIDIVEFISDYVTLQKAGRNFKGLCPFHADTAPSFIVFPDGQRWYCFGACATGGDIFTFLMRRENMDFAEALRVLSQRAGIPLAAQTEEQKAEARRRNLLQEINAAAAQFFHHVLLNSPRGQTAREYLEGRQIAPETWSMFQLGYGLPEWDALLSHLTEKGYLEADISAAGLTVERETGGFYDRFRGRLVFPICDARGRAMGFGARALDESEPKYVNTPQTSLFDKGSMLFGVHLAREAIREAGLVIIVEGYMDVLMGHQHGFRNVVASMGTALTENQVRALRKLTKSFVLAMDADAAGEEASLRGLELAKKHYGIEHRQSVEIRETYQHIWLKRYVDANIKVITMPAGRDPDDVIRTDPQHWSRLVDEALPLMDYYFQVIAADKDLRSAQGKSMLVRELLPLIGEIADAIERAHYLQKLARLVRIDERTLAAQMPRVKSKSRWEAPGATEEPLPILQPTLENYCLWLLLRVPQVISEFDDLTPEDFGTVENRTILRALVDYLGREEGFDIDRFRATLDAFLAEHLDCLLDSEAKAPPLRDDELMDEIGRSVGRLKERNDRRELEELESLLRDARERGDGEEELALRGRVDGLMRRVQARQRVRSSRNSLAWTV
jgi:DNA primase